MENASKALIMAGTILIGVLLISLMVYLFSSAYGMRSSYSQRINNTRIAEFNAKFIKYNITQEQYTASNGKNYVTIHDIVSIANYADEFNEGLNEGESDYITISISGVTQAITNRSVQDKNALLSNSSQNKYVISSLDYNTATGRVSQMIFELAHD